MRLGDAVGGDNPLYFLTTIRTKEKMRRSHVGGLGEMLQVDDVLGVGVGKAATEHCGKSLSLVISTPLSLLFAPFRNSLDANDLRK
jgi:hypothetical protein